MVGFRMAEVIRTGSRSEYLTQLKSRPLLASEVQAGEGGGAGLAVEEEDWFCGGCGDIWDA